MKKIRRILIEIFIIALTTIIACTAVVFAIDKLQQLNNIDSLSGNIKMQELHISLPVFGTITELDIQEGQLVKKGDIIAKINFINEPSTTFPNSDILKFDSGTITVISPEDARVANVFFPQGSVLKRETDFLVLYPFKDTTITFTLPDKNSRIEDYSEFYINDESNKSYKIKVTGSLASGNNKNQKIYYSQFEDPKDSQFFYNKEDIEVIAKKKKITNSLLLQQFELQSSKIFQSISIKL